MKLKEKIIEHLKGVIDPGSSLDVISIGLIKNLNVTEDGSVSLELKPSSPICPLIFSLALNIQNSLNNLDEIKNLSIKVLDHQMADEVNRHLNG